jgi:Transposase
VVAARGVSIFVKSKIDDETVEVIHHRLIGIASSEDALDDVRAAEARRLAQDGHRPLLKNSRWCILKRKRNLTSSQRFRLREPLHYKPEDRAGLPPQGGLPAALGLQLPDVGCQIPRRLVYPSPALTH